MNSDFPACKRAVVYANVYTRFADDFEFDPGAEIRSSIQTLHTRSPMGLQALAHTSIVFSVQDK